jgi:hypothetical protein
METNLRPLTLGEILDRTAQLYRSNFWLFAGISAVYAGTVLVLNLLQIGLQELFRIEHLTRDMIWLNGTAAMFQLLFVFLFGGIAVAANNRAVAWVHLGEPATIRGAYASILPRAGRYLWLMTIMAFILWLPFAVIYGAYLALVFFYVRPKGLLTHPQGVNPAVLAANQQATLLFGLATVAFVLLVIVAIVWAVLMGLRYALAIAASVVEDLEARQALRRSIDLGRGSRGRIFVLGLLVLVIQSGLVLITQMFFLIMAFKQHGQLAAGVRVLQQFIGFVTNTFIGPMYATGLTLFYYDQRIRKEGYDIEWLMKAAGMTEPLPEASGGEIVPYDEPVPPIAEPSRPHAPQPDSVPSTDVPGTRELSEPEVHSTPAPKASTENPEPR